MTANPFPSTEMVSRAIGVRPWARLSTNENEFGPAPEVAAAIARAATEANRYPDCEHFELRTELTAATGADFEQIHVQTGIDGLLGEICHRFARDGTVVTTEGTYATFGYFARAVGARVEAVPYRDLRVDAGELARRAIRTGAAVVYLAEPDNPTGTALGPRTVMELADALAGRALLVVDGAYAEYQPRADRIRVADVIGRRMLWLRTFSKAYGLAGMRVGYALGAVPLLDELRAGTAYYAVSRIAQQAALAALTATAHLDHVLAATAAGRAHYTAALRERGHTVLDGVTNFVTLCGDAATSADELKDALVAGGVFARAVPIGRAGLLRLTIGPAEQRTAVLGLLPAGSAAPQPH
jgi:histidinol-phosphate aminotransferase